MLDSVLMLQRDSRTLRLLFLKDASLSVERMFLLAGHDQLRRPRRSDGPVIGERSLKGARHTYKDRALVPTG